MSEKMRYWLSTMFIIGLFAMSLGAKLSQLNANMRAAAPPAIVRDYVAEPQPAAVCTQPSREGYAYNPGNLTCPSPSRIALP
jgi:hypothetical protein